MTAQPELVQQLRLLIQDMSPARPTRGKVDQVYTSSIDVTLSTSGRLRRVPVIGGTAGLLQGDPVYLMYFDDDQVVALTTRGSSDGEPIHAGGAHNHANLYFTKAEINAALARKAELDHNHPLPLHIEAKSGTIGGFTIGPVELRADGVRIGADGRGYIAFGADSRDGSLKPPTGFGDTDNPGAWLGYDFDGNQGQLSLYKDATHFLKWDGTKLTIEADNFRLTAGGYIEAEGGGHIGSWNIGTKRLYSGSSGTRVELNSNSAEPFAVWAGHETAASAPFRVSKAGALFATGATISGAITAASGSIGGWTINPTTLASPGGNLILDSTGSLRGAYVAGVAGWKISEQGNAEFLNIVSRGELRASSFVMEEVHAVGGQVLIRPAGVLYEAVTTV